MRLQKVIKDMEIKISNMETVLIAKTNIINLFLSEFYEKLPSAKDVSEK